MKANGYQCCSSLWKVAALFWLVNTLCAECVATVFFAKWSRGRLFLIDGPSDVIHTSYNMINELRSGQISGLELSPF